MEGLDMNNKVKHQVEKMETRRNSALNVLTGTCAGNDEGQGGNDEEYSA